MTPEQKQQAKQLIADWTNVSKTSTPAVWFLNGDCMAGFLQELVDAPTADKLLTWTPNDDTGDITDADGNEYYFARENAVAMCRVVMAAHAPEADPFGYFKSEPFGWTDCAETDDGAIALYTAPHEPKPVARVTGYYGGYLSIVTVDGQVLHAGTALYAAQPEPSVPDNVARDAARLDWLDERNAPHGLGWEIIQMPAGNVYIHTLTGDKAKFGSIRDAIDAAMSEKGKQA